MNTADYNNPMNNEPLESLFLCNQGIHATVLLFIITTFSINESFKPLQTCLIFILSAISWSTFVHRLNTSLGRSL